MAVRWNQAQERSVRHWRRVLDSIGQRSAMAIVSEVNELGWLCEMSGEHSSEQRERCRRCVVFADASQCADTDADQKYVAAADIAGMVHVWQLHV